jgi:hypothetical protein
VRIGISLVALQRYRYRIGVVAIKAVQARLAAIVAGGSRLTLVTGCSPMTNAFRGVRSVRRSGR